MLPGRCLVRGEGGVHKAPILLAHCPPQPEKGEPGQISREGFLSLLGHLPPAKPLCPTASWPASISINTSSPRGLGSFPQPAPACRSGAGPPPPALSAQDRRAFGGSRNKSGLGGWGKDMDWTPPSLPRGLISKTESKCLPGGHRSVPEAVPRGVRLGGVTDSAGQASLPGACVLSPTCGGHTQRTGAV